MAGAIKDTRRGLLVGQKTYGKGLVQKRFELPDGGAMSLTISTYYTPNGISINDTGITPQVSIADDEPDDVEASCSERRKRATHSGISSQNGLMTTTHVQVKFRKISPCLKLNFPTLQQQLEEERIYVSLKWLKQRVEQVFNLHVGIEQIVDLEYDRQLQEAIRIIKADEVEKYLNPPEDTEPPFNDASRYTCRTRRNSE